MTQPTDANKTLENSSNDDQQSDDSGFAASPEFDKKDEHENTETLTRPTKLTLTRALSTPLLTTPVKKFTVAPSQKGFMEKFIASRGKLVPPPQAQKANQIQPIPNSVARDQTDDMPSIELNQKNLSLFLLSSLNPPKPVLDNSGDSPPIIERDLNGRPIRKGFVPVEEKIASEIKDLKMRETELRVGRMQKMRESKSSLDSDMSDDSSMDSQKINPQVKISGSVDALNFMSSRSPSPQVEKNFTLHARQRILQSVSYHPRTEARPLSLSELVEDLDPQNTPHSHKLIERFETMIQEKQKKDMASKFH